MIIQRAYKTQLDPNNKQRNIFGRCAGTARFVYNWALADRVIILNEPPSGRGLPGELRCNDASL